MIIAGLTGNIGSGKTTVSCIFKALGIPVFHADEISKELLKNPEIISEIVALFGSSILNPDHSICRKTLASIVFANPESIRSLNAVLHPKVLTRFGEWVSVQKAPYIIQEAAIIYESGITEIFDRIIHVACPETVAIKRVMERDGVDANTVLQRLKNQLSDSEKSALADFVIHNDGQHLVIPQVLAIHEKLLPIGSQSHDKIPSGTTDS